MIGKGRRHIQYGSKSYLVPAIDSKDQDGYNQATSPKLQQQDDLDGDLALAVGSEVCTVALCKRQIAPITNG